METAIFGLIGVVVGAFLTIIKEWWFKAKEKEKNAEYLAILITSMLERFVVGCAEVVADDGLYHGQLNSQGERETHTVPPTFDPLSIQVEWKALPANLMNDLLSFPLEIESARTQIDGALEFVSSPPDYEEFFEERQYQYALLGLRASKLSAQLRAHVRLPSRQGGGHSPVSYMQTQLEEIDRRRAEHAKAHALAIASLETGIKMGK
ncbi:MAG TPA: hypothetical protein VME63_16335 [Dyella sp.]|uniref:hypothetical protein n=1 Tax=Dyella sp. TaxID=1869338 RepID=UPI002B76EAD5|nr:hypothetical protein [Dyella sp.]HTV86969.1 hypothetical protein [Dyella sp.]